MLVKLQCPHCGASMEVNDSQDKVFCSYCGTEIANLKERIEITQNVNMSGTVRHVMDRSNDPNLYISYASAVPNVVMVVRIVDTGKKNTYLNGQTQTYHLSKGSHTIVLKIGKRNYERTIIIPEDNSPVRINAAYTGRVAEITIDQPNVGDEDQQTLRNNHSSGGGKSPLSIVAFILSLTGIASIVGVVLAIIDLINSKKDKKHSHGMSIAALIIGIVFSLSLIVGIASSSSKTADRQDAAIAATSDTNAKESNAASKPTETEKTVSDSKDPQYTSETVKFDVRQQEYSEGYAYYAVVEIKNTGSSNIYLSDSSFDLEDSNGHLLQTENFLVYTYRAVIKPGEKGYLYSGTPITFDSMPSDGVVVLKPQFKVKTTKHEPVNYEVFDTSLSRDIFGVKATGRVKNNTEKNDSYVYVRIAYYDANGNVLGISGTSVTGLDAGATVSFEISGIGMNDDFTVDDVASYEVLAQETYYGF